MRKSEDTSDMRTPQRSAVAANVRAEAARRSIRQADMAAALGISQTAMSRRLTGDMSFDVEELQAVAAFLEVDVTTLLAEQVPA